MSADMRTLDENAVRRLEKLWEPWGSRNRFAGRVAEIANNTSAPTPEQVATQAQMLGRIVRGKTITTRSRQLIAEALGMTLAELDAILFPGAAAPVARPNAQPRAE